MAVEKTYIKTVFKKFYESVLTQSQYFFIKPDKIILLVKYVLISLVTKFDLNSQ